MNFSGQSSRQSVLSKFRRIAQGVKLSKLPRCITASLGDLFSGKPKTEVSHSLSDSGHAQVLEEIMSWIARAQDATNSGGISAYYAVYGDYGPAYPETTGYIIPTMLRFADQTNLEAAEVFRSRAKLAADWLLTLQQEAGGFTSGFALPGEGMLVFDSGQILVGLVAAWNRFQDTRYRDAAQRLGEWLCEVQSSDGSWKKFAYEDQPHVYYTMVSRALAQAAITFGKPEFESAALRNLEWVVSQQAENGWFTGYHLRHRPVFLHFIAYTLQGLIDTGRSLNASWAIESALKGQKRLAEECLRSQTLPGAYDSNWNRRGRYECLTGLAQMALVWQSLFEETANSDFHVLSSALVRRVASSIELSGPLGIRGGVAGSFPIWGRYLPFRYPNWSAKFAADALMIERVSVPASPPQGQLRA